MDSAKDIDIVPEHSQISIPTGWIGMGKGGFQPLAKQQLWTSFAFIMLLVSLWPRSALCQQCRIHRCNTEYVASTSTTTGLQDEQPADVDYCIALRAYSQCTKKTARACRGDLVYHSAVFRIKELFSQHNCSNDGPTASAKAANPNQPPASELCDYESRWAAGSPKKFVHCGLFGDPHLRTFRDEFQTCKVEGAWPLIDNQYLSVQVTNVPVVQGSSATATSKITVIFKSYLGCTEQKVYQATTEDLPSAFMDGTTSGGTQEANGGSLRIVERTASATGFSSQVEIQARYIATSIIVRQVGRYLTFAIRVPEDMLNFSEENTGLQLCLHGCPRNELIKEHTLTRQSFSPRLQAAGAPQRQAYTVEHATAKCREILQVEDVYFQSCVFDLLTTGDPEFSMAAYGALQDLKALPPSKLKQSPPRTPRLPSGAPDSRISTGSVLCLGLMLLLFW
ncbi:RGM domain family, member D [Erpetoichthys calabaricus]|nr:RGM domain family, member D [Erpetoichthys calabaricus]